MNLNLDNLPEELKRDGLFCLHKMKQPRSPHGGNAKVNDPTTFDTYDRCRVLLERHPEKYDGLGILLCNALVGIDLDHCIKEDGKPSSQAQDIMDTVCSYTERSFSGTGLHILCHVESGVIDWDRYKRKNSRLGVEVYADSRYLTVTGDRLNEYGIECRTEEVKRILERYMLESDVPTVGGDEVAYDAVAEYDDAEVLSRMLSSRNGEKIARLWSGDASGYIGANGNPDDSAADLALCDYLAYWCNGDAAQMDRLFRESGRKRDKWFEKHGKMTYGEMTIAKAIQSFYARPKPPAVDLAEQGAGVLDALNFLRSHDAAHNPRYSRDDMGGGYLLADHVKPIARPLGGTNGKGWMCYDGKRWVKDPDAVQAQQAAKDLSKALCSYAAGLPDNERPEWLKWAGKWASKGQRDVFVRDARTEYILRRPDFDKDRMLFNCQNGTLDLRTGVLRPHNPDDMLTQIAGAEYDPDAESPLWTHTVEQVLPDAETRECFQRWCGYLLTGSTKEEKLLIMYGRSSRNGKSTLLEAVAGALGDYAASSPPALLSESTKRDSRGPSDDIARLQSVRLCSIAEPSQTMVFDAALLKTLTGGDTISCRFLNEGAFQYKPQFKIVLNTNYLPRINDMTVFRSGRIHVIPFERRFSETEQDHSLKEKLSTPEARRAILRWMVDGYADYTLQGLDPSTKMHEALKEYEQNSDKVARFITDCMESQPERKTRTAAIYEEYRTWCRENGQYAESASKFNEALRDRGFTVTRGHPSGGGDQTTIVDGWCISPHRLIGFHSEDDKESA